MSKFAQPNDGSSNYIAYVISILEREYPDKGSIEIRSMAEQLCKDEDILNGIENLSYSDFQNPNSEGYKKIAKKITDKTVDIKPKSPQKAKIKTDSEGKVTVEEVDPLTYKSQAEYMDKVGTSYDTFIKNHGGLDQYGGLGINLSNNNSAYGDSQNSLNIKFDCIVKAVQMLNTINDVLKFNQFSMNILSNADNIGVNPSDVTEIKNALGLINRRVSSVIREIYDDPDTMQALFSNVLGVKLNQKSNGTYEYVDGQGNKHIIELGDASDLEYNGLIIDRNDFTISTDGKDKHSVVSTALDIDLSNAGEYSTTYIRNSDPANATNAAQDGNLALDNDIGWGRLLEKGATVDDSSIVAISASKTDSKYGFSAGVNETYYVENGKVKSKDDTAL